MQEISFCTIINKTGYLINFGYNIASRAAQSNSVYVSVLKIPIVHADSVSKSLRQNFFFFFARAAIVSAGENIIFRDNNGYKQKLGPPVPKRRQFCDLSSWARVKRGRKRENQRKRRLGISAVTIRFTIRFSRRI